MHLNPLKTIPTPGPWKNCLPQNWSLVPKGWDCCYKNQLRYEKGNETVLQTGSSW